MTKHISILAALLLVPSISYSQLSCESLINTQVTVTPALLEQFANCGGNGERPNFRYQKCVEQTAETHTEQLNTQREAATKKIQETVNLQDQFFETVTKERRDLFNIYTRARSEQRSLEAELQQLDAEADQKFIELQQAESEIKTACETEATQAFQAARQSVGTGTVGNSVATLGSNTVNATATYQDTIINCMNRTGTSRSLLLANQSYDAAIRTLAARENTLIANIAELKERAEQEQAIVQLNASDEKKKQAWNQSIIDAQFELGIKDAKTTFRNQLFLNGFSCFEDWSDFKEKLDVFNKRNEQNGTTN